MSDVMFRRIHGRIVPIKLSPEQKKSAAGIAKGSASIAAGVGVSVAGGHVYKAAVVKSADLAMRAFESINKFRSAGPQGNLFHYAKQSEATMNIFKGADRLARLSTIVRKASVPIGAGLIAGGVAKVATSLPKKNKKQIDPVLAAGGSAAVAAVAPAAFKIAHEAFTAGQGGRQAVFAFGQSKAALAKPFIQAAFKRMRGF